MYLIGRLKDSYQKGKEERDLLKKKFVYYSLMDESPLDADMFFDRVARIHKKLDSIPKPRGFLEELAYALGSS